MENQTINIRNPEKTREFTLEYLKKTIEIVEDAEEIGLSTFRFDRAIDYGYENGMVIKKPTDWNDLIIKISYRGKDEEKKIYDCYD